MINKLPTLLQLLKELQQVPYLASKHIYRVANHFLEMDERRLEQFCTAISQAQQRLKKCAVCWTWQEIDKACIFCSNPKRDQKTICVVETWYDVWAIEKTESYQGAYHVLGGSICPLEGLGPEDLTIYQLSERVKEGTQELILALSQTPEGEATGAYIARKLQGMKIQITCLARGMPVGSALETLDRLTLHKALNERRPF